MGLESESTASHGAPEDTNWSAFSLAQAMRGMEEEDDLYSTDDLKEIFE